MINSPEVRFAVPDPAIRKAGLRYTTDSKPGITRRASGKGFAYSNPDGTLVKDKAVLRRIRSLVIPPAWKDVWISPWDNSHIQVTGRDDKGRKQYRYHPEWTRIRNDTKYHRMIAFGKALPALSEQVRKDLALKGMPKRKVVAAVISLLARTRIRIGNEEYRRANGSYGLTTLRNRHAKVGSTKIQFLFRGKSGRTHRVEISDRRLAGLVRRCQELPGQDLFEYVDEDGQPQPITSSDINEYLHEATGQEFTSKDFRTWAGTLEVARILQAVKGPRNKTQAKRHVVCAVKAAADCLGNLPSTCRKHYVHPAVIDRFLSGESINLPIRTHNGQSDDILSSAQDKERKALIRFLRQYERCVRSTGC